MFFGVESGSPKIQQKLNKGIDLQEVVKAFELVGEQAYRP